MKKALRFTGALVILLAPCMSITAQSTVWLDGQPGDLLIGNQLPLIGHAYFEFCGFPAFVTGTVNVWGYKPTAEINGIDFSVTFGGDVLVFARRIDAVGFSDTGVADDDIWSLRSSGCDMTLGSYLPLVSYDVMWFEGADPWFCVSDPSVAQPVWYTCTSETLNGDTFPSGHPINPDGCFSLAYNHCTVKLERVSWGNLRARY